MTRLPVAVIGIVQQEGSVLVVRRSTQVIAPGQVCFPGGGLEAGESESAGLQREFQEELSLAITPVQRVWRSEAPWRVDLRWWLCRISENQEPACNPHEVESCWWEPWTTLTKRDDLLASNRHFLEALERGEISLDGGSI